MAKPEEFAAAGGGGTRLWPASRRSRPKQLLSLGASESLLAATFRRLSAIVGVGRTQEVRSVVDELSAQGRTQLL